jgi:hypothetical protein
MRTMPQGDGTENRDGYSGLPLRCELAAAFLHPHGLNRAETAYILGTFPSVKRKDEARTAEKNAAGEVVKPGRNITKHTILAIYGALTESIRTGTPYQTRLAPPPAGPRCYHPPQRLKP